MAFGQDIDTENLWSRVIIPRTAETFNYPIEKIVKSKINLNALFFAFAYHFGLELDNTKELELGKVEKPFIDQVTDIKGKSRVFGFRNMPCNVLAERYKEYRISNKNELALRALKMKMMIRKLLDNKTDERALAEMAEILLEEELIDKAIDKATEGLNLIHPMNAETIKFYCIFMRAHYKKNESIEADKYCYKAIKSLDYHWGEYHPLHATIYSILAHLLIKYKENLKQAQSLYKASLISCIRVLGPNHLRTAEVYMDFGKLYLRMGNKEQALINMEKAYFIYEVEKVSITGKHLALLANAALQIATILEGQRRFKEAISYSRKATELYFNLKGIDSETYIASLWLLICISYEISSNETVGFKLNNRSKNYARNYLQP